MVASRGCSRAGCRTGSRAALYPGRISGLLASLAFCWIVRRHQGCETTYWRHCFASGSLSARDLLTLPSSGSRCASLRNRARTTSRFFFNSLAPERPPLPDVNISVYRLRGGIEIPKFGFGTYLIPSGDATYQATTLALEAGYRMFDTAQIYDNEIDVGRAILDSGLPREKVFVETKVWRDSHGYQKTLAAGEASARRLGLQYVDLLLMHSPGQRMVETYDALWELQRAGTIRAVGVANFGIQHLEALRQAGRPPPAVNQIEMHPVIFPERKELVSYCQQHGILIQAFGSMLSGKRADALAHPALTQVARVHERSPNQVLLRWGVDRDFQVIPKSVNRRRILENADIWDFNLSQEEIQFLETDMSASIGALGVYWNPVDNDPVNVGVFPEANYGPDWGERVD